MSLFFSDIYSQTHQDNRIIVSASEADIPEPSRYRLPKIASHLSVVFQVHHRILPDHPPHDPGVELRGARREFQHSLEQFASVDEAKPAVAAMLSSIQLPFRLESACDGQLRWRDGSGGYDGDISDAASVAIDGVSSVVDRVSELGVRIAASESGRVGSLEIRVTILKVTVVSEERFLMMFSSSEDEDYRDLTYLIAMYNETENEDEPIRPVSTIEEPIGPVSTQREDFEGYHDDDLSDEIAMYLDVPEDLASGIRVSPFPAVFQVYNEEDDENDDESREIASYFEEADRRLAAAFETATYEGDCDEAMSKLSCAICVEDVAIGSCVTRLPCSHRYHRDCIAKWLNQSRTCPICRSTCKLI